MHIDELADEQREQIYRGSALLATGAARAYYNELTALLSGCSDPPSDRTINTLIQIARRKSQPL
jgi:hypothetical protein